MAATQESVELTEQIFEQAQLALDDGYNKRLRQLGDAACKAGIEATIRYLAGKSQLSQAELEMLSAGNIPDHIRLRDCEALIEKLSQTANPELSEDDKRMCREAFDSGLAAAIYHLLRTAHTQNVDLLSLIPSTTP